MQTENKTRNTAALAGEAQCKPSQHHIAIYESIDSIRSVIHQLNNLRDRITGDFYNKADEIAQEKDKPPTPSFINVLNQTPDQIRAECNEADRIIQEIREMLFN